MIRIFQILFIGAGLMACSSVNTISVEAESVPVTPEYENPNRIDSIVSPYADELQDEMNAVIATASEDYVKGRPNGVLNNWAADAILEAHKDTEGVSGSVISLLNVGGLRNPLSQGEITIGDIYKLMPFDNMVVCVELPMSALEDIAYYFSKSGGEPLSGAIYKNGEIILDEVREDDKTFWILTSDYLMNGGDKMTFFDKKVNVIETNVLLRETFIAIAKKQEQLIYNNETRIFIER